ARSRAEVDVHRLNHEAEQIRARAPGVRGVPASDAAPVRQRPAANPDAGAHAQDSRDVAVTKSDPARCAGAAPSWQLAHPGSEQVEGAVDPLDDREPFAR